MTENQEKVLRIFNDYYGEERVDFQSTETILIHWPEVTVTNENDNSVVIKELYANVLVDEAGLLVGTFKLNRSEYTASEWYSDYLHSHVNGITKNDLTSFRSSCLGNGPILSTTSFLNTNFDEDMWMMFALELDKYVHTESLSGVPYKYLEHIFRVPETGYTEVHYDLDSAHPNTPLYLNGYEEWRGVIDRFLLHIVDSGLFQYSFGSVYEIADSRYDIIVKFSNEFIKWFNQSDLSNEQRKAFLDWAFSCGFLIRCKAFGNSINIFEKVVIDFNSYRNIIGTPLWMFKGERKQLMITGIPDDTYNLSDIDKDPFTSRIIYPKYVLFFINKILNVVNHEYGKENTELIRDSELGKKTYYISTYNY